jgi:hypothetical protein
MDTNKIRKSILSAIELISDEVQSVCNEDLAIEYNQVLEELYEALQELDIQ